MLPVSVSSIAVVGCTLLYACGGAIPPAPTTPTPPAPAVAGLASRTIIFEGQAYAYVVYVPAHPADTRVMPALFLVHGAGGNGPDFLRFWQSFADARGIILVAPTLPLSAGLESRVPTLFVSLADTVTREWPIDPNRMYVFGYSAGGYVAFDVGLLDSTYFAAAAVFAAVITPDFDWIISASPRRSAIALYMGDHDQFFTLDQARRTRDVLVSHGIEVHYVELSNHDHDYASVADTVNQDAWQFLSAYTLMP